MKHLKYRLVYPKSLFFFLMISVFAGCQIPYPKREFLTEEEPDDKGDKVSIKVRLATSCLILCRSAISWLGHVLFPS